MDRIGKVIESVETAINTMEKSENIITSIYRNHLAKYTVPDKYLQDTLLENGKLTEKDIDLAARLYAVTQLRKEYTNQAKVLAKAHKLFERVNENVNNEVKEPDEDWVNYLLDKVKIISNDKVQELWACILAQECLQGGSFRKVMLDRLALLDRKSALLFQILCRLTYSVNVSDGREYLIPLYIRNDTLVKMVQSPDIYFTESDAMKYQDIFCIDGYHLSANEIEDELEILNEIGLISLANDEDENDIYSIEKVDFTIIVEDEEIETLYQFDEDRNEYYLVTGFAHFTKFGLELYNVLKKQVKYPVWYLRVLQAFFDYQKVKSKDE